MFGFRNTATYTPKGNVFDIEEIRQLVLDFPIKSHGNREERLIPLASGAGFTTRNALQATFARLLRNQPGSISLSAVALELDAHPHALSELVGSRKDYILSKSRESILSAQAQEGMIEELQKTASRTCVDAAEFSRNHDLDLHSIPKLLAVSEDLTQESTLQLLVPSGESTRMALELGHSYIYTLSVLLAVRKHIESKVEHAHGHAQIAVFSGAELSGLKVQSFSRLAQSFAQSAQTSAYDGYFEIRAEEVAYIPRTYLLRKARKLLKEVAIGAEPFCDLEALVKTFPTFLQDIEAAQEFVQEECLHKDGSKYKWHFVSHYAFADAALNSTAQKCHEVMGSQRYINTKPFVLAFPKGIQKDLMIILQDRIHSIYRHCGGNSGDVLGLDEYMIFKTFISELEIAAKRLAMLQAETNWQTNSEKSSLVSSLHVDALLQSLQKESDVPAELLMRLWADQRVAIKSTTSASFNRRTLELETERIQQAEHYWRSRVAYPMYLHEIAIAAIEPGQLTEQLSDLLCTHIAEDLVPSALKRMQSKGYLQGPSNQKQIEKLRTKLAAKQHNLSTLVQYLATFGDRMGFAVPSEQDYKDAHERHLREIVQSMQSDTDSPRLFLSAVIILLSKVQGSGVVYATGKFAPRLLKLLKTDLDGETYQVLERIKEKVKANNIDEGDRQEIRDISIKAVQSLGLNVENDT